MSLNGKPSSLDRWTITPSGRRAIVEAPVCICDVQLYGILLRCPDCGTVYGSMKDLKRPRATRWTIARNR